MNSVSPFNVNTKTLQKHIDSDTKIVFVSDLFVDQYVGGAELTTDALIQRCPYKYEKIHSRNVDLDVLESGQNAFWIFGNFSSIDLNLIPTIIANMNYAVLEYDYKYCRYRSPEKHLFAEQTECNCHNEPHGKMISAFYLGAKWLFWMSELQMRHYFKLFPFLKDHPTTVLSSVFDDNFFVKVKNLREKYGITN